MRPNARALVHCVHRAQRAGGTLYVVAARQLRLDSIRAVTRAPSGGPRIGSSRPCRMIFSIDCSLLVVLVQPPPPLYAIL